MRQVRLTPGGCWSRRASGCAAATAPSIAEDADGGRYEGRPVSGDTILAKQLSCLAVDAGPDRCYDSAAELQAAELGEARASRHRRPSARAAACGIWEILISACASENNLNTNGSGWNNRISSRFRN